MRFDDIFVDRFGVLNKLELTELSPGMTVICGGNGSGKTTLVSFLRGLLFGYTTDHQGFQSNDDAFGGSVTLKTRGRAVRAARECSHGISSDLSLVDTAAGVAISERLSLLPEWVNEAVYQEVFSVGYQEASRFDLLSRLCLDGNGTVGKAEEIRRTETALRQCREEREGNGVSGGLRSARSDLEHRRVGLLNRLAELRQHDPAVVARIASVEADLSSARETLRAADAELAGVQAEIQRLEELIIKLKQRNTVPLDRQKIEESISRLTAKQERWRQIRESIRRELGGSDPNVEPLSQSGDALQSIRALVQRLEHRIETVLRDPGPQSRDVLADQVCSEVYSLCDYVTRHESAVAAASASQEQLFIKTTLQGAEQVEATIQGRLGVLQSELARSADVLAPSHQGVRSCSTAAHAEFNRSAMNGCESAGTYEDAAQKLTSRRSQLVTLSERRSSLIDRIQVAESELADLKLRRSAAGSLADIEGVKVQIADVETRLVLLGDRWRALEGAERDLQKTLERLRSHNAPAVLELASVYISRLTDGECFRLNGDSSATRVLAETRQSSRAMPLKQLSRGTRDLVALAMRLALIQCRAETTERCPLILDDVFIAADNDGASAAADLLLEIAAEGQQIIFFTSQNDVRELFVGRDAEIRTLDEQPQAAAPVVHETPQRSMLPVLPAEPVKNSPPQTADTNEHTNWLFYLEVDNPVDDLSGLTVAELEAMRASGIEVINQLLSASVDELEERFRQSGYAISRERIRAWRGQAEMATQIPMLRRSDAELLFAAGIQTTRELSRMRPEGIYDLVIQFQSTQAGMRFLRSGQVIDRQQAINWSRWSQHARSLSDARTSRSRFFVRTASSSGSTDDTRGDQSAQNSHGKLRITGRRPNSRRQPRPKMSDSRREQQERRKSQRRERMSRRSSSYRTRDNEGSGAENESLRFYLNRSDDVESAPSIGPKTAQRLAKAGVYTVDDLLKADPATVAEKLANRRISDETIIQWQNQAGLMCQVPGLRNHDAQILVACGITAAEQLSAKRPADLFAIVGPFAETAEGERIMRRCTKPDLEEVTDWISWAQKSRPLKAAA